MVRSGSLISVSRNGSHFRLGQRPPPRVGPTRCPPANAPRRLLLTIPPQVGLHRRQTGTPTLCGGLRRVPSQDGSRCGLGRRTRSHSLRRSWSKNRVVYSGLWLRRDPERRGSAQSASGLSWPHPYKHLIGRRGTLPKADWYWTARSPHAHEMGELCQVCFRPEPIDG